MEDVSIHSSSVKNIRAIFPTFILQCDCDFVEVICSGAGVKVMGDLEISRFRQNSRKDGIGGRRETDQRVQRQTSI